MEILQSKKTQKIMLTDYLNSNIFVTYRNIDVIFFIILNSFTSKFLFQDKKHLSIYR